MLDNRLNTFVLPFLFIFLLSVYISSKPIEILGIFLSLVIFYHCGRIFLSGIYSTYLGVYLGHNVDPTTLGDWAVVTGATDGIGLAYCKQLARLGLNIVLISRNEAKLADISHQIHKRFAVDTKYIPVDFSRHPETYYNQIKSLLDQLEVGILINNVGKAYDYPQKFHCATASLKFPTEMININIHAVTQMTAIVLPQMLERNKGAIVNIGSLSSFIGFPYFSLYSATKSFMQRLTQDLQVEYKDSGVIFQLQIPSYITSKISKISTPSFLVPTPNEYVKVAVNSLGLQSFSSIWPSHRIFVPLVNIVNLFAPKGVETIAYTVSRSFWLKATLRRLKKQSKSD